MSGKFETVTLVAAGGLVMGSLAVAVIDPPSSQINIPRAQLAAPENHSDSVHAGSVWGAGACSTQYSVMGDRWKDEPGHPMPQK